MQRRRRLLLLATAGAAMLSPVRAPTSEAYEDSAPPVQEAVNASVQEPERIVVTARRREEEAQNLPIGLAVVPVDKLDTTGTVNVGQLTQLVPTVQFFSSNPRNTAITIRGLGTSFGLTNDGLDTAQS